MKAGFQTKTNKTIGIITGSGPEAGIDLWLKILKQNREYIGKTFRGDIDAPQLIVHSIPQLGLSMEIRKNDRIVWEYLKTASINLSKDTDLFCIACNTLHYYHPEILNLNLSSEFISMIDAVKDHIIRNNIKRIALLGVKSVIEMDYWSPYNQLQEITRVEKISNPDKIKLKNLVYNIKKHGSKNREYKECLINIIGKLKSDHIFLACTELPLLDINFPDKNIIDNNELLAKAIIKNLYK